MRTLDIWRLVFQHCRQNKVWGVLILFEQGWTPPQEIEGLDTEKILKSGIAFVECNRRGDAEFVARHTTHARRTIVGPDGRTVQLTSERRARARKE